MKSKSFFGRSIGGFDGLVIMVLYLDLSDPASKPDIHCWIPLKFLDVAICRSQNALMWQTSHVPLNMEVGYPCDGS